jgi:capsular exopolysaccharide synthesis family protein
MNSGEEDRVPAIEQNPGEGGSSSDVTKPEARNGEVTSWKAPVRTPSVLEATSSRGGFLEQSPDVIDATGSGLLEYWRILGRRKGIILLLALLGGLAGIVVVSSQPKTYKARVDLEVKDVNQDFPNIRSQTQIYYALSDIGSQIRLLQSEGLADRTKAKVKKAWEGVPIANSNYAAPVWRLLRFADNSDAPWAELVRGPQTSLDSLLRAATDSVKVHQSGMTRVIEVEVDSVDARLAADFANTLAQEFINQNIETRWKMSEHTGDWLDRQLQNARNQLEKSEDNLQAYARSAGLLFPGGVEGKSSASVSEDRLREIQAALSTATADRVAKQSRYDIARASPPEGLPDVLNDATLRDWRTKITELEREIADLTALYTSDYPKVKRLEAQLHLVESNFARQRAALLDGIKNEYQEAVKRETLLATEYDNQAHTVTGENEKAVRYAILRREVDSNQQLLDAMLQRIKEAGVSAALRESNVNVLDAAKIPRIPYKPAVVADVGVGLFAGLFLGVAVAVVRERSDRSFRGPGQTALWLNIPELGIIPDKKHNSAKGLYSPGRLGHKERVLLEHQVNGAGRAKRNGAMSKGPELVTLHRKSSMMAEAFRIVLPYVISRNRDGNDLGTIVLTSANPAEGKTTVVCNLAIAFAEIGKRVLLVDADLRRPRLHTVFGLDNKFGLCSILQDGWTSIKPVSQMGYDAGSGAISENLYVLPSGPPIREVGKALFTDRLPELFATLKEEFDIVLIDSPPVLQIPDARVLGRMADGVILVVRAGHTTREAALAAFRSLSDVHCRVLGTILNYWDPNGFPFESYAGYYRH